MKTAEYYGELKPKGRSNILKIAVEAVANTYIGELENVLNDNPDHSEEYREVEGILGDVQGLINTVYKEVLELEFVYTGPEFGQGVNTEKYLKFEGKENILKTIKETLEDLGYCM